MKTFKTYLLLIALVCAAAAPAGAMSRGWAVPLEVAGGYGIGLGGAFIAFTVEGGFKGGFDTLWGALLIAAVYPGFSALGVYGVGELAEGDSESDVLSLGIPLLASYASFFAPIALGDSNFSVVMAIVLPPLVSTLTYNLVKDLDEDEKDSGERYTQLLSFSVGL